MCVWGDLEVHSIGPIDLSTNFEINWYKIDKFRKHAKIVCFYLTSCDAKTVHRTSLRAFDLVVKLFKQLMKHN